MTDEQKCSLWRHQAMSGLDGRNEIIYQMTMSSARQMLEKGLITTKDYRDFEEKMQQKYNPVIGVLFSDIDLI